MDISAHFIRKITAAAHHGEVAHWVRLSFHEHPAMGAQVSEAVLFFAGDDANLLADQYAAAINSVNEPEQEAVLDFAGALALVRQTQENKQ